MSLAKARRSEADQEAPEVQVNLTTMQRTLDAVGDKARAGEGFTLFTVNLDHVVKLNQNRLFREAYERANFITADGWPIVWLIQQQYGRGVERTTGADLLEPMCKLAAEQGHPLYFIGPSPASQKAGLSILAERYPGLIVAGAEAPMLPAVLDEVTLDAFAERINASGARVCILSLGAPKQEVLADALFQRCPKVGFLCVGAALDFISGHAARAPRLFQSVGMEWFWRMVNDPKRLALRYASCGVALVKLALPTMFRKNTKLRLVDRD
jgi:N-acetylglucosaminyldiphosphoundecaprenol N-acetyl-beta-D-mannosaminyltransferase